METLIELAIKGYKVDFRATNVGTIIMRLWSGPRMEKLETVLTTDQIINTLNIWNETYEQFKQKRKIGGVR